MDDFTGDREPVPDRLATLLLETLQAVDAMTAQVRTPGADPVAEPGSDLAGDDEWSPDLTVSHGAYYSLSVGVDALDMLRRAAVTRHGPQDVFLQVSPWGAWPLLRAALEGAAQAAWLLGPDDRATRISRRLRMVLSEAHHEDQAVGNFGKTDVKLGEEVMILSKTEPRLPARQKMVEEIRSRHPELSVPTHGGYLSMSKLIDDAAEYFRTPQLLGWWNVFSGASHGDFWAGKSLSVIEDRGPLPGNRRDIAFNPSMEKTIVLWATVTHLVDEAWSLWSKRSRALS